MEKGEGSCSFCRENPESELRPFAMAVSCYDWKLANSLIKLAVRDTDLLNQMYIFTIESILFLRSEDEVLGIARLIKKLNAAKVVYNFEKVVSRVSFLATCIYVTGTQNSTLPDTVDAFIERLQKKLCHLSIYELRSQYLGSNCTKCTIEGMDLLHYRDIHLSAAEIQLQLSAFNTFLCSAELDLAKALSGTCFVFTFVLREFGLDLASAMSTDVIQGLLTLLVEKGAENLIPCFFDAARRGNTPLVAILLTIAKRKHFVVDIDQAFTLASEYDNIGTMNYLVGEAHDLDFSLSLNDAAVRGSMKVVQWCVQKGFEDMELCLALVAATRANHVDVAAFLLPQISRDLLKEIGLEILKVVAKEPGGNLDGVAFLLHSDFLGAPTATYALAHQLAISDDDLIPFGLKSFLLKHWSVSAFNYGIVLGYQHYSNFMWIIKYGESPLSVKELPGSVRAAIAYLPLYKECAQAGCCLLSQRLRGQLVEAVRRLGGDPEQSNDLLACLKYHLSPVLAAA